MQQVEEVLVLQKRIAQIQKDKTQAQDQLNEATNKLDTIQKQLTTVTPLHAFAASISACNAQKYGH